MKTHIPASLFTVLVLSILLPAETRSNLNSKLSMNTVHAYRVLYSFCSEKNCMDGAWPYAGLIMDKAGNLYGTTSAGGATGEGTVFKLGPGGHEKVLYSFCSETKCVDGYEPDGSLIMDAAGNLYGTTSEGGANGDSSYGTVFKLDPEGREKVLYSFCSQRNCMDGEYPFAGLIMDATGNLYGTTFIGGAGGGTVFKLGPGSHEKVLYSFCSETKCVDGSEPAGSLIMDAAGNLYGTTREGGAGHRGTVFKLDTVGHETVLYSFCSLIQCADGFEPSAGVIMDEAGNLYGTTVAGGAGHSGTVFKLDAGGHETVLYSFCSQTKCVDGRSPSSLGGLVMDAAGNLYGTTFSGGTGHNGTVFKLDASGHETVLHSFCSRINCADGKYPFAGLIMDATGNLYGTTFIGGAGHRGTVFKIGGNGIDLSYPARTR